MEAPTFPQEIRHLIQADLRNFRLLHGLQALGLTPADFYTDLHVVIFALLGLKMSEYETKLFSKLYWQELEKYMPLPIKEFLELLNELAEKIYGVLKEWKVVE